ncbi:MAG: hypothetical protein IKJ44_04285 [Elusimicrobiaceae bacterium]|nr:hypothetical protein [Elusimicrobiaceae bacterium]
MKKWILMLCLPVLLCLSGFAADMQQAEQLYREGKYAAALGTYEDLLRAYPNDPFLYYNIGNCYFKMGSRGLATANYYRAWRANPRDKDITHNLSLALTASGEKFVPAGMPAALHQAFFGLTLQELKVAALAGLWFFGIMGTFWLFKRRFGALVIVSLLICIVTGGWYAWRSKIASQKLAVVAAPIAELRSGPGDNFPASANVAQGHLLLLQDSKDQWYEVIVKSQGLKGWIEADTIEKI